MAIKEFFKKLSYEIERRENIPMFSLVEFYFHTNGQDKKEENMSDDMYFISKTSETVKN